MTELREPESPPRDSSTEERLALIAEGATLTLEQAVRELLDVADDAMRSSSGVKRPDEVHGGAYLSRWRFARLRNALAARPPEEPPRGGWPVTDLRGARLRPEYLASTLRQVAADNDAAATDLELHIGALEAELAAVRAAPLRGPSPRLPDTFVERAIRAAQVMVDPNDDTAVMLSAFEASAIRRGVSAPALSGPHDP